MSGTSSSYWHFMEAVRDELGKIAELASDAYLNLESEDDRHFERFFCARAAVSALDEIWKRLEHVGTEIDGAVPLLKKADAALEAIPTFKAK